MEPGTWHWVVSVDADDEMEYECDHCGRIILAPDHVHNSHAEGCTAAATGSCSCEGVWCEACCPVCREQGLT